MGGAASCSSTSALPPKKHDVFISFRGDDTRSNFTSHLCAALLQKNIETYIDYRLHKGDEIKPALLQAIEDSSISVVVFSENYAFSKWCLDELTHILKCKKDHGQYVIPVFYKIDPSHVRSQTGTYKEAFAKHEKDFKHDQDKVISWKDSLNQTANLSGWDSRTYRDESEFIQSIVNDIVQKMNLRHPSALEGPVGIDENCKCIESLLEEFPIIGIWGVGGIGKTTMAKAVFVKLSFKYESCRFLENLKEESEKHGLTYIRDKLLLELLKEENFYNSSIPHVVGSTSIMRRICNKKVFIVLDDIDKTEQLEYLARECHCLGAGSRVIITTRNKHVLFGRVNKIYEAKALSYYKSLELFNLKAFHKDHSKIGYEQLSERAVVYSKGIPLVLIVLGSFLHSKTKEEWDSALIKLKKTPNEDIQEVLKLSYVGLNYEEREIFLNIACFLKGEDKDHVIALLDSYGFHATIGVRNLVDKALITIGSTVQMHDLIQKMGWEIVREECIKEPERRSRLWDPEEVYDVLKSNRGTDKIEAIILDLSKIKNVQLSHDTFKKMTNLKFLKFYSPWHRRSCIVNLPSGLESLSDRLRYLQWDNFPSESLPSSFCAEKLVELRMRGSHVKKLWNGVQDCVNLRRMDLAGSKQLEELPDFSKARNLEEVNLSSCESLCHLHPSILSNEKLVYLLLGGCKKLKNLQSKSNLKSLRDLSVTGCCSLKEFSLLSDKIEYLFLDSTGIQVLDPSIGRLKNLQRLNLNGSTLKILPINELCGLRSLKDLHLFNCGELIDKPKLYVLIDALLSLQKLYLDGCCDLTELPNNIKHLPELQVLSLKNCMGLRSLPELPPSIQEVDATNCTSLETLLTSLEEVRVDVCSSLIESSVLPEERRMLDLTSHSSIRYLNELRKLRFHVSSLKNFSIYDLCCLTSLKALTLFDCGQVIDKSKLHVLFDALRSLEDLYLEGCSNLSELPENISALSSLYLLGLEGSSVESLPASIKHLSKLDYIYLINCRRLRSLPELPPFIKYVKATNCTSLEIAFPLTISRPHRKYLVESLFLENDLKLEEHSLRRIDKYAYFSFKRVAYMNQTGAVCYPGSKVPEWFTYNKTTEASSSITIDLSSPVNNLSGFVFCSVLPRFTSKNNCRSYLKCQCYIEDGEVVESPSDDTMIITKLNSDHVYLWYDPICSVNILRQLKRRGDDEDISYNPKLSFEFSVCTYKENDEMSKYDGLIKACGVCPIYASEYHNFLQQMESELSIKTERSQEIDEHSLCGIMEYSKFSLKRAIHCDFERNTTSYSGSKVPEWFTYGMSTTEDLISVHISPDFDYLLGFVFCFVIPQFTSKEMHQSHSGCRCRYENSFQVEGPRGWHYSMTNLSPDNVFLWSDPLFCELILEKIRRQRVPDEGTAYNPLLSFEFEFGDCLIKECGVRPIYASEYSNFLQQMELKLELGTKTKRRRDTDEQEQHPPTKKLKESFVVQLVPTGLELSELPTKPKTSQIINEVQLRLSELQLEH